jgi:hypothetical protein
MAHAVLIPAAIAAMNVDSYNRSVSASAAVDNGWILTMGAEYTTGSLTEVFAVTPVSASGTGLWMAYSGDEIVVTDLRYKGLDPDPRNFFNAAGKVFSAYKPQVGDIIVVTADAFTNSRTAETYAAPSGATFQLLWTGAQAASGLCYKYIATTYISLATGAIDSQRVTAYKLECVQI